MRWTHQAKTSSSNPTAGTPWKSCDSRNKAAAQIDAHARSGWLGHVRSLGWRRERGRGRPRRRLLLQAAAGEAADVALDAGRGADGRLVGARARAPRGAAHRLRHAPHRAVQDPPAGARRVRVGLASCRGGGVGGVGPGAGDDDGRGDEEEENKGGERDGRDTGGARGHGFLWPCN